MDEDQISDLVNSLYNFRQEFPKIVKDKCVDEVPIANIPTKIRFGIAAGKVYELEYPDSSNTECIGYCINLASRLESYCRDIGFIVSAKIELPNRILKENGYEKVLATKIKGSPEEIVFVDKDDYENLDIKTKKEDFKPFNP